MALADENSGMVMPVAPIGNYGGYGNGGFGGWGGDFWLILILLFAMGGWGNGFGGFGGFGGGELYPWMNQAEITTNGFQNQATNTAINSLQNSVTSGFGDVQLGIAGVNQNICQTGAGITAAINNTSAQAEIAAQGRQSALTQQLYSNELNNLNRSFAEQTANTAAINGVSKQIADCCCQNQLQTQALNSTIISENCADREALNNGVRDILTATQAQNQRILDKLCDQELQAERRENDNLRTQLNMANLAASQTAQTARLLADNAAQTQQIENYVRPQINPAYIVPNPYAYNFYPNNGWGNGCCNNCGFNG